MTILNAIVYPDSILLASSSGGVGRLGARVRFRKLEHLPDSGVLLGMRGTDACFRGFCEAAVAKGLSFTLDRYKTEAGEMLTASALSAAERLRREGIGMQSQYEQIVACGWSDAKSEYTIVNAVFDAATGRTTVETFGPGGIVKSPAASFEADRPTNLDDLVSLSKRQMDWLLRTAPEVTFGGELLIAQITRGGYVVRNVGPVETAVAPR